MLESERMGVLLDDLHKFQTKYNILPEPSCIFNMFKMIYPTDVKVVIIGQSPYPNRCKITNTPYACGIAFLPDLACSTIPVTLQQILQELYRDMGMHPVRSPVETLLFWIKQGVMLLNESLTLGVECPEYLKDHSVCWMEIMVDIISNISQQLDPIFLLIGQQAWKFETCISSPCIKVSHPVSRVETSTPWVNSGVFTQMSRLMIDRGQEPIVWM